MSQSSDSTPLFVAIAVGLICLTALKSAFYGMATAAWHYYLAMYVSEMLIAGAMIKCCSGERFFKVAITLYLLSMINYLIGLGATLLYSAEHLSKHNTGLLIDSLNGSSEVLFIALITIACLDISNRFNLSR